MAHPRKARSKVQIYYNDFERGKQYCADVKATKNFEVKDVQNAGVMVYDYNDKSKFCFSKMSLSQGTDFKKISNQLGFFQKYDLLLGEKPKIFRRGGVDFEI